MNAELLLEKYFPDEIPRRIILEHSRLVAAKALEIASGVKTMEVDFHFIEEASMLHDIGVCRTSFPGIGNSPMEPYIRHGIIGREILEAEGFPRHALVCERHIGVGLAVEDIRTQGLPLPERDMVPISVEERIICMADLFFSKHPGKVAQEKTVDEVKSSLVKFGNQKVLIFESWLKEIRIP